MSLLYIYFIVDNFNFIVIVKTHFALSFNLTHKEKILSRTHTAVCPILFGTAFEEIGYLIEGSRFEDDL